MCDSHSHGKFIMGAIVGAALGALTCILINPDTRKKLTRELKKHVDLDQIKDNVLHHPERLMSGKGLKRVFKKSSKKKR